jgi:hypothetical protein
MEPVGTHLSSFLLHHFLGGQSRIRTYVGSRRQIYSLFPLATRASTQERRQIIPTTPRLGHTGRDLWVAANEL